MKLYLAGPMRGLPAFNFPAFDDARRRLHWAGHVVFSPATRDRSEGFDPSGLTGHEDLAALGFDLRDALAADLEWICRHADGVALLDGWGDSAGARAEEALARAIGIPAKPLDYWLKREDTATDDAWREVRESLRADYLRAVETAGAPVVLPPEADDDVEGLPLIPETRNSRDEVRVVSSTGGEKGSKLARFDLIPPDALRLVAEHFGHGAAKYADRNWERGYPWGLSYAALNRHLWAWWDGEENDPELGDPHLAAVAFHALVLLTFSADPLTYGEHDDRPGKS